MKSHYQFPYQPESGIRQGKSDQDFSFWFDKESPKFRKRTKKTKAIEPVNVDANGQTSFL
jgi:hypothetical protein